MQTFWPAHYIPWQLSCLTNSYLYKRNESIFHKKFLHTNFHTNFIHSKPTCCNPHNQTSQSIIHHHTNSISPHPDTQLFPRIYTNWATAQCCYWNIFDHKNWNFPFQTVFENFSLQRWSALSAQPASPYFAYSRLAITNVSSDNLSPFALNQQVELL